jgi:hypothetical protein
MITSINQVARMVQPISDWKWRALDTVAPTGQLPAMRAVAATFAECKLSRRFGSPGSRTVFEL